MSTEKRERPPAKAHIRLAQERVLDHLLGKPQGTTVKELSKDLKLGISTVQNALARLKDAGLVSKHYPGHNIPCQWHSTCEAQLRRLTPPPPPKPDVVCTVAGPRRPITSGPPHQFTTPASVRPGADDHKERGSRRGDIVVPYKPPMSMCVGNLKDTRSSARN